MAYHRGLPGPAPGSGSGATSGFHFLNSPFGDTTYTKVFVGGLAWETQNETLRRYFEQFGEILEAVVITDKNTGRSKGYGFHARAWWVPMLEVCQFHVGLIWGTQVFINQFRTVTNKGSHIHHMGEFLGLSIPVRITICENPIRYASYGPEYAYPQMYNPYTGQQYVQIYSIPGTGNTMVYPLGQSGQPLSGGQGYPSVQGYTVSGHPLMQFSAPSVNAGTSGPIPTIQTPYPAGAPVPQPQLVVTAHSPQFTQGSGSDQTAG